MDTMKIKVLNLSFKMLLTLSTMSGILLGIKSAIFLGILWESLMFLITSFVINIFVIYLVNRKTGILKINNRNNQPSPSFRVALLYFVCGFSLAYIIIPTNILIEIIIRLII